MHKIAKLNGNEKSYTKIQKKTANKIENELLNKFKIRQDEISADPGKTKEFIIKKKKKKNNKRYCCVLSRIQINWKNKKTVIKTLFLPY